MSSAHQDPYCLLTNSGINRNNPLWKSVRLICPFVDERGMILLPKVLLVAWASVLQPGFWHRSMSTVELLIEKESFVPLVSPTLAL